MTDNSRPSWEDYFFDIAKVIAKRSVCFRSKCGAVIVKDKVIISTGYNGAPRHQRNCAEIGFCYRDANKIKSGTQLERCRACGSHAESNAIALAAKNGHSTDHATLYLYGKPFVCTQCKAIIANAGIDTVMIMDGTGRREMYSPERDWNVHPVDLERD